MPLPEVIETLRSLNEPVPRPPRLPTESEIAAAEERLGFPFPAEYRYFLLHGSDVVCGTLEPAQVTPDAGHTDLVEVATTAWETGVPRDFLPFCESNGDYYCLAPDGRVVYWSHNGENATSWQDLAHWIEAAWIGESGEIPDK
jgi:hypothetical protein